MIILSRPCIQIHPAVVGICTINIYNLLHLLLLWLDHNISNKKTLAQTIQYRITLLLEITYYTPTTLNTKSLLKRSMLLL